MRILRQLKSFASALLHRGRVDDEFRSEIDFHVSVYAEDLMRQGVPRIEAERRARVEFGSVNRVREECRAARGVALLDDLWGDLRYAARMMRRSPGFAAVAILSLGFGLGANTAIFTLVDTVMLKSLPVKNADRLFFVDNSGGKSGGGNGPPYPCYEIMRDHNQYFSGLAAFSGDRLKVTIDGVAESIGGQYVSGSYFELLGVQAVLGRVLTPADDSIVGSGGPEGGVAVISYGLWKRRFGMSPAVLGKKIQVGTNWVTIVGVTRPEFFGLQVGLPTDLTIPMMLTTNNLRSRTLWWLSVVGRLKDGVSPEQARAELDRHFQLYMEGVGGGTREYFNRVVLVPAARGLEDLRRKFSKPLLIVMTIVGLVLLIGCANVANLLLARASARRNEIAMRLAIGASRARLMRQMLTEGLLLVAAAATVGIVFAKWALGVLVAMFAGVRGRIVLEPHFDARIVGFTAAVALVTALLFSVAPALHATRAGTARTGSAGRTSAGRFQLRLGNALVAMQIMLSMVLLCGAALFVRTLQNLTKLDAGFQREDVLTMRVSATFPRSPKPKEGQAAEEEHARFGRVWEDLIEPVGAFPWVRAASISTLSPLSGRDRGVGMQVSGEPKVAKGGIHVNTVSAGYFEALGVTPLLGRVFTPRDRASSLKVAILNERAARERGHDGNVLGKRVNFPGQRVTAEYEVIGVVRDVRYESLRKVAEPVVYIPIEQALDPIGDVMLAIRVRGGAASVVPAIRQRVQSTVPGGFVTNIVTLEQQAEETLLQERLVSILASAFGGLALFLAAIGLYGTMSFSVIARTREIGIRMAVGAQRSALLWLVLRGTLAVVGIGLVLAAPLVVTATGFIRSELFGVSAGDPASIATAAFVLTAVALAAAYRPAWRASRIDPMVSLRQD
jgi:predicted permease